MTLRYDDANNPLPRWLEKELREKRKEFVRTHMTLPMVEVPAVPPKEVRESIAREKEEARVFRVERMNIFSGELLRHHYPSPEWDAREFIGWARGHWATGPADKVSQRAHGKFPRVTRDELSVELRNPLQDALEDYAHSILFEFLNGRYIGKERRFVGCAREHLWLHAATQVPYTAPVDYARQWWFRYAEAPEDVDLIDRREFIRVVHYSNLVVTRERPERRPAAERLIFNPRHVLGYQVTMRQRDAKTGYYLPNDADDDEYDFHQQDRSHPDFVQR